MIVKAHSPRAETDPRRAAGARAERQMAHYLDRHFGNHEEMHVLHDVRLSFEGDAAQLDHLVVHPFGVAIIESKSVTTSVRINAAEEWERRWNGRWQGMPDPLLQGERQGILLRRLLMSRTADLLDKVVFGLIQGTFRNMAVDVFAAISDQGTIKRSRRGQAPRAMKADAVPKAVSRQVHAHRKAASLLNPNPKTFNEAPRSFNGREVLRIAHFLRTRHVEESDSSGREPEHPASPRCVGFATPISPQQPSARNEDAAASMQLRCKECGSTDLDARIGRWGPYGKCDDCGANTSVRRRCPACDAKVRLERSETGFVGTCEACGATEAILVRRV